MRYRNQATYVLGYAGLDRPRMRLASIRSTRPGDG